MISELIFIRDYTSFWRTLSPLSEDFIRKINILVHDRYEQELESESPAMRRAVINETGFEIFSRCRKSISPIDIVVANQIEDISKSVSIYISRIRNKSPSFKYVMETMEINEAKDIATRLLNFFDRFNNVVVRPSFSGCGRLNACQGDVLADNKLYEVKSGSRKFKSIDLRQLVLYMALNHYSKQYEIQELGLYNPRKGFHFVTSHQDFSLQFCGLSAEELCHRIGYELIETDFGQFDTFM